MPPPRPRYPIDAVEALLGKGLEAAQNSFNS
jgi:hypothetical protein